MVDKDPVRGLKGRGKQTRGSSSGRHSLGDTKKELAHPEPPGYRIKRARHKPQIGHFLERITEIINADKNLPKKQRHSAKRIYERIKDEGYQGGYTQVKEAMRQIRRVKREVFMPLIHRPGEAPVDFGFALAKVAG